jgi:hypothetical protein
VLPQLPTLTSDERRLLKLFKALGQADQASLLAFAEFLEQRGNSAENPDDPEPLEEPLLIPRPEEESVIGAIKRLSSSYHMLDKSVMLNETSSLMTAHLMHGRPAPDVIDELEQLFSKQYGEYRKDKGEE